MRTIFTFLITLFFANTTLLGFTGSCSGTSADPYLIASASQLNEARNDLTSYCEQMRDVTLRLVWQHSTLSGIVVDTITSTSGDIKLSTTRY